MHNRTVAIVTDSTAYLPQALVDQYQIHVIPLRVQWGDETFRDGVDIKAADFYERLKTDRVVPTTAAPSIGDFHQMFDAALETADAVVGILISSALSATCSVAEQAKALMPGKRIEVIDSYLTSMAMGYVVLAAARAAEQGKLVEQVLGAARAPMLHAHVVFTVETLEYLRRGGRIGAAQAFLGDLMDVKPILGLREGRIEPMERVRTKKKALDRMADMIVGYAQGHTPVRLAALHALAPDEAADLMEAASVRLEVVEKVIAELSPAIATHTGPGTLGLVCCPA